MHLHIISQDPKNPNSKNGLMFLYAQKKSNKASFNLIGIGSYFKTYLSEINLHFNGEVLFFLGHLGQGRQKQV